MTDKGRGNFFKRWWAEWVVYFGIFLKELWRYLLKRLGLSFGRFEGAKDVVVGTMYQQRGRYGGVFIHTGMVAILFLGLTLGPTVLAGVDEKQQQIMKESFAEGVGTSGLGTLGFGAKVIAGQSISGSGIGGAEAGAYPQVLGESVDVTPQTQESEKPRSDMTDYTVKAGDTLKSIADKFGVTVDTVRWANTDISSINSIKPGQVIHIPPVTGLVVTVKSGETIYSIAKKYNADAQSIVDFPFNTFANDETFALAVGQSLVIPDGVVPDVQPWSPSSSLAQKQTPNAGVVTASGSWIWPAAGIITQPWRPWHPGIDIANHGSGPILAADAGRIVAAGWDSSGYGNKVLIDHGNGFVTLYGHLATGSLRVQVGQTVNRGDVVGMMGSTGRSTGTHLHFEIHRGGGGLNPLQYLK